MVVRATGINPAMLRWARERAGYSVEEVASRIRVPPERVEGWETGRIYPTWKQLENLAYRFYHRSATLFFLDDPPEEPTIQAEFPRLPPSQLDDLHPDTLYAVRQARARQHYLRKLAATRDVAENRILSTVRSEADPADLELLAASLARHIGYVPVEQTGTKTEMAPFSHWRDWIEQVGIWIFLRDFRQADISGFCLGDYHCPVIYLNAGLTHKRTTATALRQFAHLIFDFNHIELADEFHYLPFLDGEAMAAETACNDFVKEFIECPEQDDGPGRSTKARKGGPNFYAAQATRLGKKYLRAAFLAFEEERIDEATLAAALGVSGQALDGLERFAW